MGKKIWFVGVFAALLFAAAALIGYRVEDEVGVQPHLLLSFAAGMLVVFCHLWILVYLALTGRLVARTLREAGLEENLSDPAVKMVRILPVLVAALVATVAVIAFGDRVYTGRMTPALHQALAWGALALQVVALAVEKGVLERREARLDDLGRRAD